MKKEIIRIITTFIVIYTVLCCSTTRPETSAECVEQHELLSKTFIVRLPTPFYFQKDNYEEGVVYFYGFTDGAYIIIFEGGNMEFPMDKYNPIERHKEKNKTMAIGILNDKLWRKDKINGNEGCISIYYNNVIPSNKKKYDRILNSISFKVIGNRDTLNNRQSRKWYR